MRVSILTLNLVAEDAIGQCILHQLRFHLRRGDEVQVYSLYEPHGVAGAVRERTRVVRLADLLDHPDAHFAQSELYVFHYPSRHPLMEALKGLERGATVLYYHNVTPPELWGNSFMRRELQHSVDSVAALAPYADLIVTVSPFNAEQLVEQHGCDPERVRILPLAVPLDRFAPGPPDPTLLRRYDLEGHEVILFVGRMAGNKRIDLLVEALPRVRARVPHARLLLVGDTAGNPAHQEVVARAQARAAALQVADHVRFTGVVEEVAPFYRLADVYATASLHEGFGVPLIEAMASGVPVVASRATAHPWVLGEAGLLVEPDDAEALAEGLVQVLTDDSRRGELVRRGLARARDFSLEQFEIGWGHIVAEATAWLPDAVGQPRPRSLPAQPTAPASGSPTRRQTVRRADWQRALVTLGERADIMTRGYVVRSKLPVVGPLVAWVRRTLTSHLREPYLDPMLERQVTFNRQLVEVVEALNERLPWTEGGEAPAPAMDVEARLRRLESQLALLSAQVALFQSEQVAPAARAELAQLRQGIEALRAALERSDVEPPGQRGA